VERRQKLVLTSAKRSDAVVSSLFPREVKERLYIEQEQQEHAPVSAVNEFMGTVNPNNKAAALPGPRSSDGLIEASPIAALYPETTILFADMVGFTGKSLPVPSDCSLYCMLCPNTVNAFNTVFV
jgi:hypothetical protein